MKKRIPSDCPQPPPTSLPAIPGLPGPKKVWTNSKSNIKTACKKAWCTPSCAPPRFMNMTEMDLRMINKPRHAASTRPPGAGRNKQEQKPGKRKNALSAGREHKSGV